MMFGQELLQMMKDFLNGKIEPEQFSFDFPARLSYVYDDFHKENPKLCDYIEEDIPEFCAAFESNPGGNSELLNADQLKEKVKVAYQKALAITN
jgi:hypothetical protein